MDQNAWIMLLVGIAVTSSLFALGVVLYPKLKTEQQGYPFEAQIEAALLPFIYDGICAAYKVSEKAMDDFQKRVAGLDKKKIAVTIHQKLPDKIGTFDLVLVKRIVPEERFEKMVQDQHDRFIAFYEQHHRHFENLFEEWKAANAPSGAPAQPMVTGQTDS